jgi:beta-lactamase regulating signal transducer with metallopeptidase domain
MVVLVPLVLPTLLPLPTNLGYWFGDEVVYAAEEAGPTSLTWQGIVSVVWLAVAAGMVLFLLQRAVFARRLVAGARNANHLMNDTLRYCCRCMGVKGKVRLKVSPRVASPVVCGLFRPVILVPHNLAPSLGSRHLRAVLLHELAHIKRGDLWVNLAQTVLQIIYFYNPLLWLANSIIRRIREQAVDEAVLAAMGEKAPWYPETLVNVAKLTLGRPALGLCMIGVVESKNALTGRIKRIRNRPMPQEHKV